MGVLDVRTASRGWADAPAMSRRSILRARIAEAARAGIDITAPAPAQPTEPIALGLRLVRGQCPVCLERFGRGLRAHRDGGCTLPAPVTVSRPVQVDTRPLAAIKQTKKRQPRHKAQRKG